MKILYHHRTQAEDAQGIHIRSMVKAFRDMGHDVEMVSLVEMDEKQEKKVKGGGWESITKWMPTWLYELMGLCYNLYGYRRLAKAIRKHKPDLIYERYSLNSFCGVLASKRFGVPLVLEVNSPLYLEHKELDELVFERIARFTERWICSNSTWTIVVTGVMKKILEEEGIPGSKIVVMYNGIDPEKFNPEVSAREVREKYGLEDRLVIGFVGWFRPWHGLELLLEIMKEGRLHERGVSLLLVGDGPAYDDLHAYARDNGILDSVVFTGPVNRENIAAHVAAMDVTVQPRATEYACPMKLIEYMGMGKCIVAPDQENIMELLTDGEDAYLFRDGDLEDFKRRLVEVINDPDGRRRTAEAVHRTVYERGFLWSANAEKTLSLVFGEGAADGKVADGVRAGKVALGKMK